MNDHTPRAQPSRRQLLHAGAVMAAAAALPLSAHAQAGPDLRKVTLRVGDQTGASQGLLRAAGLLDNLPYQIEWSNYAAAVNLHEALKADATDIGSANDSPTVSAIAGGSRILAVASWTNGGKGTSLLVRKNSDIKTVADLRGKTISPTTRGSVAHFTTVGILKEAGIPLEEVKLAFLSPTDASAAFGAAASMPGPSGASSARAPSALWAHACCTTAWASTAGNRCSAPRVRPWPIRASARPLRTSPN